MESILLHIKCNIGRQEEELVNGPSISSKKRKTLEDLFRPPLDITHKGSFESVCWYLCGIHGSHSPLNTLKTLRKNVGPEEPLTCVYLMYNPWISLKWISMYKKTLLSFPFLCTIKKVHTTLVSRARRVAPIMTSASMLSSTKFAPNMAYGTTVYTGG